VETASTAGTVTLATLQSGQSATGCFDLTFGANKLSGTFNATFCAGGHEP
jgi:hypothetical protein